MILIKLVIWELQDMIGKQGLFQEDRKEVLFYDTHTEIRAKIFKYQVMKNGAK